MAQLGMLNNDFDENLIRHMVYNALISYNNKFKNEYGQAILLKDSSNCWRKDVYPYYKIKRKELRDNSAIDWEKLYGIMSTITTEISENLPFKMIEVEKAEADDCIAVLTKAYPGPHMIVSNDKDFQQLQKYKGVKQYSPLKNNFYATPDANKFLKEHIIRGDAGDGVPNIFSDDDVFVDGSKRQKQIRKDKLVNWMKQDFSEFVEDEDKIKRNKTMIDFDYIPDDIYDKIIEQYKIPRPKRNMSDVLQFIMKKNMKLMVDRIQDFYT